MENETGGPYWLLAVCPGSAPCSQFQTEDPGPSMISVFFS